MDTQTLHKKMDTVVNDPHSVLVWPNYRDYDRTRRYSMTALARWMGHIPTKQPIYSERDRVFVFARHITLHDIRECHPVKQKHQIRQNYSLLRTHKSVFPLHTRAFYTQCKNSSFWSVSHLKNFIDDEWYAHTVTMSVMVNGQTRRSQPVSAPIKKMCDENWNQFYPQDLKVKYLSLKQILLQDIAVLNAFILKNHEISCEKPLFSYPVQLRESDEDGNFHLNTNTYVQFAVEAMTQFDSELKAYKKSIYSMTNLYWKEIRTQDFAFCYVNLWQMKSQLVQGHKVQLCIGTVDVDHRVCKRQKEGRSPSAAPQWTHHNGFIAVLVDAKTLKSLL